MRAENSAKKMKLRADQNQSKNFDGGSCAVEAVPSFWTKKKLIIVGGIFGIVLITAVVLVVVLVVL